jgi:hypothetical protein
MLRISLRSFVLYHLRTLETLDGQAVSHQEYDDAIRRFDQSEIAQRDELLTQALEQLEVLNHPPQDGFSIARTPHVYALMCDGLQDSRRQNEQYEIRAREWQAHKHQQAMRIDQLQVSLWPNHPPCAICEHQSKPLVHLF